MWKIVITFLSISFLVLMASTSTFGYSSPELEDDLYYNNSVYKLYIPKYDPKAEIIFFHDIEFEGCEERHVRTWMSRTEPPVCWPKDWLSVDYPQARILSACYDAGNWKTESTGHMTLPSLAENLRQDILSIYKYNCPVFMVGHGLGGLVIKALVREMQQKRDQLADLGPTREEEKRRLHCFLENVKAILYYDTPCLGTEVADNKKDLLDSGSMWVHLEVLSSQTRRLIEWFRNWRRTKNCKAASIVAGLPTNLHGYEVKDASARDDVDELYTSSGTDHFSVCRPCRKTDNSFLMLKRLLDAQGIALGPVPQVDHSDESESTKLLNAILNELKTLGEGQGLHLNRDDIEKIEKFPTLLSILIDGLRNANLAKTDENADVESWEPVYSCY